MTTRKRKPKLDVNRLREAISGPGADPRSWVAIARVDDEPDARRYEPAYGWIVDVTMQSGPLAGEGPVPCRVVSLFGGAGFGASCPVALGAEVLVLMPDGDPNVQPVVVGYFSNPGEPLPSTVNGQSANEAFAEATAFAKTDASVSLEVGPTLRASATSKASVEAPTVALADEAATQPFVRGTDLQTALANLSSALNTYATALVPPGPPATPVTAAQTGPAATALIAALTTFTNAVAASLSTRIVGE